MNLREYLFRNRMTVTEFAKRIKFERGYVNKVSTGHKLPGTRLAEAIIKETNGEVTLEDMTKEYETRQKGDV